MTLDNIRIENILSAPIWTTKLLFRYYQMLEINPSCNLVQYPEKIVKKTRGNGKQPSFSHDFGPFGLNLGPKIFFVDFTSTRSQTMLQAIIVRIFKEN